MAFDNVGWVTPKARAAALNDPVSATARAYRIASRLNRSVITAS